MSHRARIALKIAVWGACLAPLARLAYRAWTDDLGANPISFVTNTLGDWTLRILLASLAMTPLRIVFGLSWPIALRRLARSLRLRVRVPALLGVDRPRLLLRLGADVGRHRQAPVHHDRHAGAALADPAGRHVDDRDDPAARRPEPGRVCTGWPTSPAVCAVLHYLWLAKVGVRDPYWYAAALVVLLGVRAWAWGRRAVRRRGAGVAATSAPAAGSWTRKRFSRARRAVVSVARMSSVASVSVNGRRLSRFPTVRSSSSASTAPSPRTSTRRSRSARYPHSPASSGRACTGSRGRSCRASPIRTTCRSSPGCRRRSTGSPAITSTTRRPVRK